ncbi:MAG: hypothetical protein EOP06_24520 [Proteobacteria bacterium]|nr:MAG: hypothetical protein EOP06_24520 [Pseudomonadota bacterium]
MVHMQVINTGDASSGTQVMKHRGVTPDGSPYVILPDAEASYPGWLRGLDGKRFLFVRPNYYDEDAEVLIALFSTVLKTE